MSRSHPKNSLSDFKDYVVQDLLSGLEGVRAKAMFGGFGVYKDDTMFGILVDDELYFKVDQTNQNEFEKRGSQPFSYKSKRRKENVVMSYWNVPLEILEDRDEMTRWAEQSYKINKRLKMAKKR